MDDLISRQKTIKEICNRACNGNSGCFEDCVEVSAVRNMPSEGLMKEPYQRGHEEGFKEGRTRKGLSDAQDDAYQRGYEAGFAEGRKQAEEHDGCVGCYYEPCGEDEEPCRSCKYRYASQYRRADDKIRVGDEVVAALTEERGTAVVTKVNNEKEARYIYADGTTGWDDLSELKKTGRHFPEVTKMLEAMKK